MTTKAKVTPAQYTAIIDLLDHRIKSAGLKPRTVAFQREQSAFMAGAMAALNAVVDEPLHPGFVIWTMNGEDVVEKWRDVIERNRERS